ncbi:unnamed protein product [Diatraea saccharalis]|uniref:Retinol dehydrogenase 11 n=1 Tax=Diatraea saccharalis TaxID=40085 RepID=A0A9N9R5C8_9NEOP|nr:unnamed protein product [Diatraea saccharalis]
MFYIELMPLVTIVVVVGAVLISLWTKRKLSHRVCLSKRRLNGKTCIVTGGTSGIGLEAAKDLARRGARVIIACPFPEEGKNAEHTIIEETGNKNIVFKCLNLASLESTREFAKNILETENRLDILINNAGVGSINKLTKDGMLYTMQINYYGHFLLTNLLLPLLKKTGTAEEKSRIVNVVSILHHTGHYNFGDMNMPTIRSYVQSYSNSKFCLILFTRELTRRLIGSNVIVNSIDPGTVGSTIYRRNFGILGGWLIKQWLSFFWKTPWHGAQTIVYAAVDESVADISGELFKDCKLIKAKASTYNEETAKTLWEESQNLVLFDT